MNKAAHPAPPERPSIRPRFMKRRGMSLRFRATVIALAACLGAGTARAGDDGAAPLWEGIGSVVGPLIGFGKEEKDPIDYREHGKIVVPKAMDLPDPAAGSAPAAGWPVNQETQRKAIAKEKEKERERAANSDPPKIRATRSFPNAPVTIQASDQPDGAPVDQTKAESSSFLGNLNPLSWAGVGKSSTALGPEPDREWLTDPPKGYRAPIGQTPAAPAKSSGTGQTSN